MWEGKDRALNMEGPVALLSAVQSVYPCPLFNESNILDAAGHELADSAIANKFYQADNLEVLRILAYI